MQHIIEPDVIVPCDKTCFMKSNRRQFLRGQAIAEAITNRPESAAWPAEAPPSSFDELNVARLDSTYLTRIGRAAMACQFEVLLGAGQKTAGTEAAMAALDLVETLEEQLTVYRNTSEISRINQTAHLEPIPVELRLFALLELAAQIHRDTAAPTTLPPGR